ncbi:uncharacterized protein [Temnothorax nylanderi]|uniref:uncharacterized protein n=1 Tax=Temnothorax nylanderi TaxID=102681 RepID=UPI003A85F427
MSYRTVSYEAATLLARIPPLHLYADYLRRTYMRLRELKECGMYTVDSPSEVRESEWATLREQWLEHISDNSLSGKRTREAISPSFDSWLDRRSGFLSFRITQFLTGHGCFGSFLYRIGKEETSTCRYCSTAEDTSEYTLASCPFWGHERGELTAIIGQVSLAAVVNQICKTREAWRAFSVFAERVLCRKEEDERIRQQALVDPGIANIGVV